jgi:hypothetical protein
MTRGKMLVFGFVALAAAVIGALVFVGPGGGRPPPAPREDLPVELAPNPGASLRTAEATVSRGESWWEVTWLGAVTAGDGGLGHAEVMLAAVDEHGNELKQQMRVVVAEPFKLAPGESLGVKESVMPAAKPVRLRVTVRAIQPATVSPSQPLAVTWPTPAPAGVSIEAYARCADDICNIGIANTGKSPLAALTGTLVGNNRRPIGATFVPPLVAGERRLIGAARGTIPASIEVSGTH